MVRSCPFLKTPSPIQCLNYDTPICPCTYYLRENPRHFIYTTLRSKALLSYIQSLSKSKDMENHPSSERGSQHRTLRTKDRWRSKSIPCLSTRDIFIQGFLFLKSSCSSTAPHRTTVWDVKLTQREPNVKEGEIFTLKTKTNRVTRLTKLDMLSEVYWTSWRLDLPFVYVHLVFSFRKKSVKIRHLSGITFMFLFSTFIVS